MRRVPGPVIALLSCAVAVGIAGVRYAVSEPIVEGAENRQEIPAPPPRPERATERFGVASDGGRVIVRRSGDWIWVWVESAPTSDCRPGGSLSNGFVFATSPPAVRGDGSFEFRDEIRNTFRVEHERRSLPHKLDGEPLQITFRIAGRVDANGAARGTFERRDRIHYDGRVAQDCRRHSTWTATRSSRDR